MSFHHFNFSKFFQNARLVTLILPVFLMFIGAEKVHADTYYVTSSEMLLNALERSSVNQAHDTIKIADGVEIPSTAPYAEIGFSLTLEAGYTDKFLSRKEIMPVPEEPKTDKHSDSGGPQQSTAGPLPPEGVEAVTSTGQIFTGIQGGTEKTIGVPGYLWRHGCGPTAVGMVLGYYDVIGYSDLFDGSAATQTSSVDQGIASERNSLDPGHYRDYSLPIDNGQPSPLSDKSELPAGDEHTSDSVADFMETSFSSRNNYYGWSWSSDISPSFLDYVELRNPDYTATSNYYSKLSGSMSWSVLTTEINNNRPMIFLVDTDADGFTDHFVTVVGYRDSPQQQYGCLDTWSPVETVRWCDFASMTSEQPWGIWGGWSFSLSSPSKPSVVTGNATAIGSDTATLNGTLNPNRSATQYYFEYGTTLSYGSSTPLVNAGSGMVTVNVSKTITGLVFDALYHFRLIGTNSTGTSVGADKTFIATSASITPNSQPWVPLLLLDKEE